ncbi:unnamed protein product [Phytophthora fragariaefolia]|uniref:Unnamed protein product n=1 Tax=Phytophthora fragariaefolia TaxID=1490495 RepID=A0A9W7D2E8_9STRA|nr:unnamed protein product [Phytophthora fragariaefolia]
MAKDLALDLREEAIAAADIDASKDENSSELTSQTELGATDGANNRTTEDVDVTPVDSTAMENEPRGGFGATPAFDDQQSRAQAIAHLASPTRKPYPGVDKDGRAAHDDSPRGARAAEHALVVSSTHSAATGRHSESSEDGRTHERLDADIQHSAAVRQFDAEGGEASRQARPQQPEQQPSAETEEGETRTYDFVGQGRHGTDSLVGPPPRLPRIPPTATVVEYRRRRYRTRVGRYAMIFEVGYMGDRPDGRTDKLWINQKEYEQLWKEGRLRTSSDDPGADESPVTIRTRGEESKQTVMLTTCTFCWMLMKVTNQEKESAKNETSYVDITDHDSETSCPQISLTDYVERRMVDLSVDDGEDNGEDNDSSDRCGEDDSSTDNGKDRGEDNGEDDVDGRVENDQDDSETEREGDRTQAAPESRGSCAERAL